MSRTVEAPVGWNFAEEREMPTPIGRIHIGDHVMRLFYHVSEGKTVALLTQSAVDDGSLILSEPLAMSGLGSLPIMGKVVERRSGNERRKRILLF